MTRKEPSTADECFGGSEDQEQHESTVLDVHGINCPPSGGRRRGTVLVALGVLLLQFATVPFLGDIDMAGKLFLLAFATLVCALFSLRTVAMVRVSPAFGLLALLLMVFFASAMQAFNPEWAFIQVGILALNLLFLLMITHWVSKNPDFYHSFVDSLLSFGLIAALLGLYDYVHFLVFGPTPFMLIPYLLPPNHSLRVGGPYGQPNLFAVFLTVVLLVYFYQYLHRPEDMPSGPLATLRLLPFSLVALVFFLTGSRGGLLSLSIILGFLTWLVASGRYLADARNNRVEFFRLLLCLGVAFIVAQGLGGWFAPGVKLGSALGDVGISTDARFVFWTSAVFIFLAHPWLGVGLDGFQFFQNEFGPIAHKALGFVNYEAMGHTKWVHNELLQILCEGGIFAFVLVIFLNWLFFKKIWGEIIKDKNEREPFSLYCYLFLLPFIIQAMFGWPLRHPALLALFFTFLGILFSQYPLFDVALSNAKRSVLVVLFFFGLLLTVCLASKEVSIGRLKHDLKNKHNIEKTIPLFEHLVNNPYSKERVLSYALPIYLNEALARKNKTLAILILPFYDRLCLTKGAHYDWYNLALLFFKIGKENDSHVAIQHAIELMPSSDSYWDFLHYLNIRQASKDTGRSMETFSPWHSKALSSALEVQDDD